jgi:hypothetical protein
MLEAEVKMEHGRHKFTDEHNPATAQTKHDRQPHSSLERANFTDFRGGRVNDVPVHDRGDHWHDGTIEVAGPHKIDQPSGVATEKNLRDWAEYATRNSPPVGYRPRGHEHE